MEGVKKILLLSSGDTNGAYEAIYKLSQIFIQEGCQVVMLVKNKKKEDGFIIQYSSPYENTFISLFFLKIKKRFLKLINKSRVDFDPEYNFISANEAVKNVSAEQIISQIGFVPDVIFTGMTDNFMNSTDLLSLQQLTSAEVYNITVDMNHFTGGCHYAWNCKGYINGCDISCPAITSKHGKNLAKKNFEIKFKNSREGNFKIITGSGWTLKQAKESKIYKNQNVILNINSLIDTSLLNNKNRDIAKRLFNLDPKKFYVLMGSQNVKHKRKGFEYLLKALQILESEISDEQKNNIEVIIVSRQITDSFNEIPFGKRHIDYIKDYRLLALLYQASDVFVNSSIEDSGPMMVSEALACGTPVVGFDMGVVNNMVINGYNGYKAKLNDSYDLSLGIKTIFSLKKEEYNEYSYNSVKQVEEFSSFDYARKILSEVFSSEKVV